MTLKLSLSRLEETLCNAEKEQTIFLAGTLITQSPPWSPLCSYVPILSRGPALGD